ncbi:hypothetical protein MPTK1_1g25840 [Marchantia polymorpha subsp. ruderalis]|uniref:FAD-binding PCMH-type domain-containing protein n=2 Tax=Marchantia polymorpha TaxID=3197 RepID=A0A176WJ71_MARPO|nr:hypothetical protein AXG93_1200s1320 [Marchantia polymorpha subsp. ruderalis]PTQ49852.1 hypothetical protein MARPO_0002s0292 [Marchantia polymorpha]PTQ49853.1 hypothetical protein MARPO_0002s0292 [Marchantia polymorpha]BBN00030.1 hypothetical protein Mp_1g25840 [Marchantia polymorpha subsp. ruderalis]BBN00031.1 hypothetical protein Mp_1g25840 [Marchantia polymorpha subsp. ruderalis]|eukprot:PTQ49852.1 hypothetical protein MARPO_0002s0292 [Marchantia polymorpha]
MIMKILHGLLIAQCMISAAVFGQQPWASPKSRRLLQQTLADCLAPSGARLVYPTDSDYESARGHVYNHRYLYNPAVFVFSTTTAHVQSAVQCAVQLNLGIAPRSGGHSYEDYSLGGRDGIIVVDLEGLNAVTLDSGSGIASVGGGTRLGPLKLALWEQGQVTIPSGTCPSVGVGGHSLGGGWGFVARKWGLMADSLVAAELVTANGTLVTASASQNSDLLFALKGAGANSFGIVTTFFFTTYAVSDAVTYFNYDYGGNSSADDQALTLRAFQAWGAGATKDVSASLFQAPSGGNFFWGVFLGRKADLKGALQTFFDGAPVPSYGTTTELEVDYIRSVVINAGFAESDPISVLSLQDFTYESRFFKSKSIFVKGAGWPEAGIQAYVSALRQGPSFGQQSGAYMIMDLFGGGDSVINSVPSASTGFVHRDSLYSIQMFTYWDGPQDDTADISWIQGIWNTVRPYSSAEAYQNYIDSDMPVSAYYASNLDALKAVKRRWDPSNIFNFPKSIPLN